MASLNLIRGDVKSKDRFEQLRQYGSFSSSISAFHKRRTSLRGVYAKAALRQGNL